MKVIDSFPAEHEEVYYEAKYLDEWRRTGSGLWRSDKPSTQHISELKAEVEALVGPIPTWWVTKHLPGGKAVPLHIHNQWGTAVYYPRNHPVGLFHAGDVIESKEGRLLVLPAGTEHGVEANESEETRYSVVFLFAGDRYPEGAEGEADESGYEGQED